MIKEFRDFINRGNLVDIAVGFVMGVAFASVVTAFTTRIVSPLIGMVFDLSGLQNVWTFGPPDPETGVPTGSVGAVMFLVVKAYNAAKARAEKEQVAAPAELAEEVLLLRQIRDALAR